MGRIKDKQKKEEKKKKRFWHSEVFWEYVVPTIVSIIISTLTSAVAIVLGLM